MGKHLSTQFERMKENVLNELDMSSYALQVRLTPCGKKENQNEKNLLIYLQCSHNACSNNAKT